MNIQIIVACCVSILNFGAFAAEVTASKSRTFQSVEQIVEAWDQEVNGLGGVLWTLAAARYNADVKLGRRWIMTAHPGSRFHAHTDGVFTLVSIPFRGSEKSGTILFCNHYNAFVHKYVDEQVRMKKFQEARTILLTLDSLKILDYDAAQRKLSLLDKLEKDVENKELFDQFFEITGTPYVKPDFTDLEQIVTVKVKNLAELPGFRE